MMMPTTPPTLQELLRLCFSDSVQWITIPPQVEPRIAWVTTASAEVQPDDLLLLAYEGASSEVFERAGVQGAAAVLVISEIDREIPLPAAPPPVALLVTHSDTRQVHQLLTSMLVNQRASLIERGVRVHTQLSQLAAQGEGLESLAHAMAEISGRGVLVQDKRLDILAQHPSSALASIWENVLHHLRNRESLPEPLRDRKLAGQQATILIQPIPGGLARLVATISVGDVARGYLSLIGMQDELDALDHMVIEQGVLVCAVEMARAKAVREAEKRIKGDLLTALLQEDLSPRDARLWVMAIGLDLEQAHVALRLSWDSAASPSRRRLETLVNGEIARQGLKSIVSSMGTEVVCICQIPHSIARPQVALDLARAIIQQGNQEYSKAPIRCGIGRPVVELSDWRYSFREAGQALDLARRFGESEPLYYTDLSVYRLLLQIEHSPELSAFQEEILGPLLAHENAAELIHTLEAYFEHNGNLSQTAEALYIHRNTLMYRMDRIGSITRLNLEDPKVRLAVQLALHILRMVGSTGS